MSLLRLVMIFLTGVGLISAYDYHVDYEGDCTNFNPQVSGVYMQDLFMKLAKNGAFAPMGSKLLYKGISLMMDNAEPDSEPRYEKMCVKLEIGTMQTIVSAFGNSTTMECQRSAKGIRDCSLAESRTFYASNGRKLFPMKGVVTWTDLKENVIVTLCLAEKFKFWVLLSTQQWVDDNIAKEVKEEVLKLGFKEDKIQTLSYDDCNIECNDCRKKPGKEGSK